MEAAERLPVVPKQTAYELSYGLLDGGSDPLAEHERSLRAAVAALPPGAALPVNLGRELFAWKNATYMARRRLAGDLPLAWAEVESG